MSNKAENNINKYHISINERAEWDRNTSDINDHINNGDHLPSISGVNNKFLVTKNGKLYWAAVNISGSTWTLKATDGTVLL